MALWLVALIIFAPVLRAVSITIIMQYPIIISFANILTMKNVNENYILFICQKLQTLLFTKIN